MKMYTWKQIFEQTKKSGGDTFFLPHFKEYKETQRFEFKTLRFSDLPAECFTTLEEYEECGLDDADHIHYLMKVYRKKGLIPPVILTEKLTVIDGYHRLSAMHALGYTKFDAFVLKK